MILHVRGTRAAASNVGVMSGMHDKGTWRVKIQTITSLIILIPRIYVALIYKL